MAKAFSGPVEINGLKYEVRGAVQKQRVSEWPEAAPDSSEQTRATRRFLQSWYLTRINGLQVDKDYNGDLSMCYDSTLETRFAGQITLPPLWVADGDAITAVGTDRDIKGGINFDGKVWIGYNSTAYVVKAGYYDATNEDWSDSETVQDGGATALHIQDLHAHAGYIHCVYHDATAGGAIKLKRRGISGSWAAPTGTSWVGDYLAADTDRVILASVGSKLFAIAWGSGMYELWTQYSLDDGDTWTTAVEIGRTAYAPTSACSYPNDEGIEVLHIGTAEGVWRCDTSGENPELIIDTRQQVDSDNCRGMCSWSQTGALYIPVAGQPYGQLLEYLVQDGIRYIRPVGLNLGAGLPSARQGEIVSLRPAGTWLFAAVQQTGECQIFATDGYGWHHVYDSNQSSGDWPSSGTPVFQIMCISQLSGVSRIHLIFWPATASRTSFDAVHAKYILDDPVTQTSMVYEDDGYIDLPWYAGGYPEMNSNWLQLAVDCDDLDATTAGEYIAASYAGDGENRNANALGNLLSGDKDLQFGSGAGLSSKKLALRLTFHRAAGATTSSPKLYTTTLEYLKVPAVRNYYRFQIDVKKTAQLQGRTPKSIRTDIEAIESSVTQVTFSLPGSSQVYVKCIEPTPAITSEFSDSFNPVEGLLVDDEVVDMVLLELLQCLSTKVDPPPHQ